MFLIVGALEAKYSLSAISAFKCTLGFFISWFCWVVTHISLDLLSSSSSTASSSSSSSSSGRWRSPNRLVYYNHRRSNWNCWSHLWSLSEFDDCLSDFIIFLHLLVFGFRSFFLRVGNQIFLDDAVDCGVLLDTLDIIATSWAGLLLSHPVWETWATKIMQTRHKRHCLKDQIIANGAHKVLTQFVKLLHFILVSLLLGIIDYYGWFWLFLK